MAHLFIRVELRGNPSGDDYNNLHAHMEARNWHRTIQHGAGTSTLPHAMYQGHSDNQILELANALREGIQANVWTSAVVLVISADNWALTPA
jgi:hypothetical protein